MSSASNAGARDWGLELFGKLQGFADSWKGYAGTEQAGAQQYLHALLEIYGASYPPGTIFEQHPVRVPERRIPAPQGDFFFAVEAPPLTTLRMDMYLPKVCVWEMKAPSERHLERHEEQLVAYWKCVRTRYMVLSNFHEIWIYDTDANVVDDDEAATFTPTLKLALGELPGHGEALYFLRGGESRLPRRSEKVTAEAARTFGRLARELIRADVDHDPERAPKVVLRCIFAMFAQDTGLAPPGIFTRAIDAARDQGRMDPVWALFEDFARKDPVDRRVPYVNGPLFDRSHPRLALSPGQMQDVYCAAGHFDWGGVHPEIFGSIFEQALDPVERHELGAHFTREADIARVVGPTVVEPWRQRIAAIRDPKDAARVIEEMRAFHVLDPACGCGNFLYVVYREMKRLEAALVRKWDAVQRKVAKRRADLVPAPARPYFTLRQLHGLERNGFAVFLARVVLWIGGHLAHRELGLDEETLPLQNLDDNVRGVDALLTPWPRPEGELAIVGNPPYLGVRKLRRELGDPLVDQLFALYPDNRAADYVTYWFTRALEALRPGERAGFVCTNSVAQNGNREASIDRILARGGAITDAWRSYPWAGEAAVHIGIVNWVMAPYDGVRRLDGKEVLAISPALTASVDVTTARPLAPNRGICFMGATPGNAGFVLTEGQRAEILAEDPGSAAVIKPFLVGRDVNREIAQRPSRWIIDFGVMPKEEAESFRGAMRHVRAHVYPLQKDNRRESRARSWWRFAEPAPHLRGAIAPLDEVLVMPCVAPHLVVSRQKSDLCFDHQLMVVALSGDYELGVLQSRYHAIWAWARGSTLKGDLRYTSTTVFETFPFPHHPRWAYDPRRRPREPETERVEIAARRFDELRAKTCRERDLGLTKVHNLLKAGELPELAEAWGALNDAVTAAYRFPTGSWREERETLRRLLELNHRIATPGA